MAPILTSSSDSRPSSSSTQVATIVAVSMPVGGTDVAWSVPAGMKKLSFKPRIDSLIKWGTSVGAITAGDYYGVTKYAEYEESGINTPSGLTFYFRCDIINTLEIKYWL